MDKHREPRCADQFAFVVGYFDIPNAKRLSGMDWFSLDRDQAFAHRTKVVGIYLDADGRDFCQVGSGDNADRRGSLAKIKRYAAVHNAYRAVPKITFRKGR